MSAGGGGGQDDGQEKSFDPTPERLRKAREEGNIAKSTDVTAAASYIGLFLALTLSAAVAATMAGEALSGFLSMPDLMVSQVLDEGGMDNLAPIMGRVAWAIAPLLLLPIGFTLAALYAQNAVVATPANLAMKPSRVSLISNAKQKYGLTGIVEFLKSAVKLIAISIVLGIILTAKVEDYLVLSLGSGKALPALLRSEATLILKSVTLIAIAIAFFDYFWRLHDHRRKLRMSSQDMKDEQKQSEGDPHMKQSRRQRGREIAMNRMMLDVPDSDVVIVNPTHYAVALKWTREAGTAPVCVAKGVDEIAARIREIATRENVPIMSDPPTARMIHAAVEIGDEVHPDHYKAVAAAIRFAADVNAKAKARGPRP
jgi:flagellar biosynthetic protein FlhB